MMNERYNSKRNMISAAKKYALLISMMCLLTLAGMTGAVAQEAQKANPASDFEYDLTEDGGGIVIKKYKSPPMEVVIPAEIEDFPVIEIRNAAFYETNIDSVIIPDSVRWIGESCFSKCKPLLYVELPKNLEKIESFLFFGCTALKAITLPDSIENIDGGAFYGSGLEAIVIPDSVQEIAGYKTWLGEWVGAFEDCKNLKTVSIGNGVKKIGNNSFTKCTSLTTVTIGNGTELIGENAFYECINLKTVTIGTGIIEIHNYAFAKCRSLTTVNIGAENVYYLNNSDYYENSTAFSGCSSLSLKEKDTRHRLYRLFLRAVL